MKHLFCSLSILLVLTFASGTTFGQSKSNPPKKKEKVSPIGFGVNIGNIGFGNDFFSFGLSPNVAYRFAENVAVGLMVKTEYNYQRYRSLGNLKISSVDFGPTVFARYKPLWFTNTTPFLQGLFLQAEFEKAYIAQPAYDEFGNIIVDGNRIRTVRPGEDYMYMGIGSSFGYPFSTFISIHYNVLDKATATRIPFDYRIGITYRY